MTIGSVSGYRATGVRDVELSRPVEAIDGGDRPVGTEWLLVRRFGEPIGAMRIPVPAQGVSAADVAAAIRARYGEAIDGRTGLAPAGVPAFVAGQAAAEAGGPPITVVICTRDNPDGLRACLASVARLTYPRFRTLVVDNAPSGPATRDLVAALPAVDYLAAPVPGLSHARNAAIAAAPGEILAFIDDDEVVDEAWLTGIARALLDHPEAGAVTGVIVPAELATPAQELFEEFGGHSKGRGFTPAVFSPATRRTQHPLFPLPPFGTGANMVFTPRGLAAIGGFDPALGAGTPSRAGEDTHALSRLLLAGGTIVYQPSALTRHRHRADVDGLRDQLHGYGLGLTAFYASILRERPYRILTLLALAPRAVRALLAPSSERNRTVTEAFPAEVLRANLRGMLAGPLAYARARRQLRAARRPV